MLDYNRSAEIAKKQACPPKFCFYNALKALRNRSLDLPSSTKYVEGHAKIIGGLIISHGWLEMEDGTILDPTFVACCHEHDFMHGGDSTHQQYEYFPESRYCRDELKGVRLNQVPLVMD